MVKLKLQIPNEQHSALGRCQIYAAKLSINVIFRSRMQHEQLELSRDTMMANHLFVRDSVPGKTVAVHVSGDGLIVKHLQQVGDAWFLASNNPTYPPRELKDGEKIFAVAKAGIRNI